MVANVERVKRHHPYQWEEVRAVHASGVDGRIGQAGALDVVAVVEEEDVLVLGGGVGLEVGVGGGY